MHQRAFDVAALAKVATRQAGVVCRTQVLEHGLTDSWLKQQLRARRWRRVHTGVYATFTGALSWEAKCWAAVLRCGADAVLAGPTALHRWHPSLPAVAAAPQHDVVVAVEDGRRPRSRNGVEVWSIAALHRFVHPARTPPLMRFEAAALLTASDGPTPERAIAVIADACQSRRTTPARLLHLLDDLPKNPTSPWFPA